jgi:methionyl aminopeptidase
MSIETQEELDALRAAGRVVAEALRAMRRVVRPGISTAELDGFYADACTSVPVGRTDPQTMRLAASARRALNDALGIARAGTPLNAIGATVERTVTGRGHSVCAELNGHGIGRRIHEEPTVPNRYIAGLDEPLSEGLVLTIEPIISAGSGAVVADSDGWTIRTADGALSAHAEHTLVITTGAPLLLTA